MAFFGVSRRQIRDAWHVEQIMKSFDKPRDRPTVNEVLPLVRAYYAKPGNEVGGHCHIVLDDGNVADDDLEFCLHGCEVMQDEDGAALMRLMLQMTQTQRRRIRRG